MTPRLDYSKAAPEVTSSSMTSDREDDNGGQRPANDNRPPGGADVRNEVDATAQFDAVVLTAARLIGCYPSPA